MGNELTDELNCPYLFTVQSGEQYKFAGCKTWEEAEWAKKGWDEAVKRAYPLAYAAGQADGRQKLWAELKDVNTDLIPQILDALERHAMTQDSALVEINHILADQKEKDRLAIERWREKCWNDTMSAKKSGYQDAKLECQSCKALAEAEKRGFDLGVKKGTDLIQEMHDVMDKVNAEFSNAFTFCLYCRSGEYDGQGIIHTHDCAITKSRHYLGQSKLKELEAGK